MRVAIALSALVLVAACGSSGSRPEAGATTPVSGSPSSSPAGSSNAGTGRGTGTPSPGTTAPAGVIAPAPLSASSGGRVTLAKRCVHRGDPADQQTVTVAAGDGETVTYSTYYSDYSSELNRPDYTTGHGYGEAGSDGRFRATWVVPAGATPGRATVRVTAGDMQDAQEAGFLVVKQGERCP